MLKRVITNKPKLHNNIFVVLMITKGLHICSHQLLVIITKRKTQQGNKHKKKEG